ncbi:MAG: adenylate/guanylate cyclase domain-containing protein [Calditrichia bacterium]|nr:adenylate/guanylate cyclase domain-containing protein [Calditrichota bacterium]MCB0268315.1 adenylate/guanylate cyclase domain-containing protein [Calditrichota bacterium]MCB0286702.1 adenylate/guanylate cyclase domain-containing protein [Calditrichota bacterium]MCB9067088.1 adenylate/guanylate cyclase domain-containing protein [Calditrichia bacterium]
MKKSTVVILIAVAAFVLSLFFSKATPALESLEFTTLDWRFLLRGKQPVTDSPVVLVTIDDESFEALPDRWPWPRWYYARAIENLTKAGARVIGIDVILDRPDTQNAKSDSLLAEQLQLSGRVVLAHKLERHSRQNTYAYLVDPIDILKNAANDRLGLVSVETDPDGIYRRYPVVQRYQDNWLTSFSLELIRKYRDYSQDLTPEISAKGLDFGDFMVPFYDAATILINFAGPRASFPQYSFASVIDDERLDLGEEYDLNYFNETLLPEGVFNNKIVIIGSTVAELHDNFPTPFLNADGQSAETPGAEILANAVNTILSQQYYQKVSPLLTLLLVLLLIAVITALSLRFSAIKSAIAAGAIVVVYITAVFLLFVKMQVVMEMVFPVFALALTFGSVTVYSYYVEQRERRRVTDAFGHYVSPKLVKELERNPEKLVLGGEERVITVMFTDIANFTTIAETLGHRELVRLLNDYLTEMSEIVLKLDGTIDKYIGDAIMAEFGAPLHYPDHATKGCLAALEMQKRLKELSHEWLRTGRPTVATRIGISTGTMIVGNMGSPKKFNYTVIGDEVNLAARLESANKTFGTGIMISEATYHFVKDMMITRPLDRLIVKGKSKPVNVYELIAKKGDKLPNLLESILPLYHHGIRYYEEREWENAESAFRKCLRLMPDDGPSSLYLKRVQEFAKNPPPPNWNRVYQMTTK